MSNSPLVDITIYSPNCSKPRNHSIDRITPHIMVGQLSAESCGNIFKPSSRQASSNYGIGKDGEVGLYVDECNRSWCSSNRENDNRAVTIECACDRTAPYALNDKVWNKLILLCADICKRNNKNCLLFLGSLESTNSYKQKENEMLLTAHRWYSSTECPGAWLYNRLNSLSFEVNKLLNEGDYMSIKNYNKGERVQLSTNFVSTEFDCKGGSCCHSTLVDDKLVNILQRIRSHFGVATTITSGYRCPTHNKKVGGASQSYHTKGQAADIIVKNVSPLEVAKYAESIGVLGIGMYDNFVHVDTRTTKFFWKTANETPVNTFGGIVEDKTENNTLIDATQKAQAIKELEVAKTAIENALAYLK